MDWRSRKIDNRFSLGIFLLGVLSLTLGHLLTLSPLESGFLELSLFDRLLGSLFAALPLFLLMLILPGSFGGGDLKLLAAGGFFLGWRAILPAIAVGLLAASVYVIKRLASGTLTLKSQFPLGPFLAVGLAIGMFWGEAIWVWYLSL